jgi:hypothetical protein
MMTRIEPQPVPEDDPSVSPAGGWRSVAGGISAVLAPVRHWPVWRSVAFLTRLGLPLTVSIAFHVAVGMLLIISAWGFRSGLAGGRARTELVISLPPPAAAPAPSHEPATPEIAAPAPIEAPPPVLQGLASRAAVAPPPTLRSAATEVLSAGELLRRQDESAIGATFAGLGARQAVSIVYVVDASGAMVSSLKFVLAELERSVRSLSSGQKFQVILFRERGESQPFDVLTPTGGRARLLAATPANKAVLASWLTGITPTGRSNPLDGLRRGLEFDPDALFLLSRSIRRSSGDKDESGVWGKGPQETMAELDRLNPRDARNGRRRVVIKAIQFLEPDPTGTMQLIGEQHGDGPGSYSVLTLEALGAR